MKFYYYFLILFLCCNFLFAEERYSVNGVVEDLGGKPLSGAKIIVKDLKKGLKNFYFTNEEGKFSLNLEAGSYEVIVEIPHMTVERRILNIPLEIGKELVIKLANAIISEGIIVTARRGDDYVELAPIASSSFSEEEVSKMQPRLLTEVLLNIPGVQLSDVGPLRPRPIIRGLESTRILVLVDGCRFNTFRMSTGAMGAELGLIDPQNVERIEVVRGAGSMFYGSDALGGVINIVTKRPDFSEKLSLNGTFFSGFESINNGKNLALSLNLGTKIISFKASGGWDKFKEYKSSKGIVPNSQAESYNGAFKLGLKIADNQYFYLDYIFKRSKDIGFAQREKAPGFDAIFPYNRREGLRLNYSGEFKNNAFRKMNIDIYHNNWEREFLLTLTPPAMPFPIQNKTIYFMKNSGIDLQINAYPGGKHLFTYGINFLKDKSHDERVQKTFFGTSREKVDNYTSVPDGDFLNFGVFFQDELVMDKAELKATLRFDHFILKSTDTIYYFGPAQKDSKASSISGNIGATYNLNENIKFFGRFAKAFRMPGLPERYYFGAPVPYAYFVPNPDLKPEISYGIDMGLRIKSKAFNGNITYFHNKLYNFLAWEPTLYNGNSKIGTIPVYHWANIEKGRIQGIEAEGEGVISNGKNVFYPFISGSWQDGKNISEQTSLPNILPYSLFYGLRFKRSYLWIELSARTIIGDTYVVAPSQPAAGYEEIKIEGFTVFNLRSSLNLSEIDLKFFKLDGARMNFGIENLTNRYYTEPFNTVPNPGRTFKFSLELKF